jgi:hypothetical protein
VDPFDVESIAGGIERVTIAAEADRLSALGRQRVGVFDWSTAASSTIEVYRRLQK